jgi:hypothetical protein
MNEGISVHFTNGLWRFKEIQFQNQTPASLPPSKEPSVPNRRESKYASTNFNNYAVYINRIIIIIKIKSRVGIFHFTGDVCISATKIIAL